MQHHCHPVCCFYGIMNGTMLPFMPTNHRPPAPSSTSPSRVSSLPAPQHSSLAMHLPLKRPLNLYGASADMNTNDRGQDAGRSVPADQLGGKHPKSSSNGAHMWSAAVGGAAGRGPPAVRPVAGLGGAPHHQQQQGSRKAGGNALGGLFASLAKLDTK